MMYKLRMEENVRLLMRDLRKLLEGDYAAWGDDQFHEQVRILKMALEYALTANQVAGESGGIDTAIHVIQSAVDPKSWFHQVLTSQARDLQEKGVEEPSLQRSMDICRAILQALVRDEVCLVEFSIHGYGVTEEDELVIRHCLGFIMYKSNPGDPVRVDFEILRSALEQYWNLNLLKQLKVLMIRTFDALRTKYEQNPSYGNSLFFSQAVEISLHKHIERLHTVMQKYNASPEDLEFPEKWFPKYIKRTPSPHRYRRGQDTPQPERKPLGGMPTDSTDVRFLLKVLHKYV